MAKIKVRNKFTGQTGTLEEADFHPDLYELNYGPLTKLATSSTVPMAAATGVGLMSTLAGAGAPLAVPAAGGGAAVAVQGQQLLRKVLGIPQTEDEFPERERAAGAGAAGELAGRSLSWLGGKILPPALERIGGIFPKDIQKSAYSKMGEVGDIMNKYRNLYGYKPLTNEVKGKIIAELEATKEGYKFAPEALKAIDDVIGDVKSVENLGQASMAKMAGAKEYLTKTGKPKYAGTLEKQAEYVVGKKAATKLGEAAAEGMPGYKNLQDAYAMIKPLAGSMEHPQSGLLQAGVGGIVAREAGVDATKAGILGLILGNPYLKFLAQRMGGQLLKKASPLARPAVYGLLDYLTKPQ